MNIPLVKAVNVQLAGRYEHYSDFGDVAKPKIAVAWDVVEGVRFRASWQQGFKAPNLETTAPFTFARAQTVTDYYRCQADLNTHKIATFSACAEAVGVTYNESGNPALQPEDSESYDVGLVLQPTFIPEALGRYTFTIDRWQLKQTGVVGVVGPTNVTIQDYLSRLTGGAGSTNVVRNAPTADDVAAFAGSGLAPVGTITQVNDTFQNLQPQTISGVDVSVAWHKITDSLGAFDGTLDATRLDKFSQPPTTAVQALFDARAAGTINAATPLTSGTNQIEALGNPKWKATGTLTWTLAKWQVAGSVIYTGQTQDINFLSTTGVPFPVKSLTLVNLYGQYTFANVGPAHDLRLRLGVRNLFDKDPPIESDGYNGALYSPYGRYLYVNLGVSF
jgi:outer membrane receptor protein involved in Fe transport